jgi:chloramphenicol O-acetyltransferase type A
MSTAENVIRYSALPWIDFTALSHARMFAFRDSCPKISFGKMTKNDEIRSMPVSIHVHHALVDGIQLGQFIECYQKLMNRPL